MPWTLSFYIGRQFLFWVLIIFGAFLAIVMLMETVELFRRASGREEASFGLMLHMALLRAPFMAEKLMVFAILFGGMATFWKLTRTQELVVTRAAGVSAWQFMAPVLTTALMLGLFVVMVLNPVSATTLTEFEKMENRLLKGKSSFLAVSSEGLWLRQAEPSGYSVIHAQSVQPDEIVLNSVIIFLFDTNNRFKGRMDATKATLRPGFWHLEEVWLNGPDIPALFKETLPLATNLTENKILDSFASPETMSFWELPAFIELLDRSGFSAHRHRMQLHKLLASPLLLCSMVLIAATFSLRAQRRGGTMGLIVLGVVTGFLLYFLSDLVFALGLSNSIPLVLAAWTPACVSAMLGTALLFHMEDG